jgi:hypothetical protein
MISGQTGGQTGTNEGPDGPDGPDMPTVNARLTLRKLYCVVTGGSVTS